MAIKAFSYTRPHGTKTEIDVTDIEPADEQYLTENNVEVSMEDIGPRVALYGKYGSGRTKEAMVLVRLSDSCRVGMTALVEEVKRMKEEDQCRS